MVDLSEAIAALNPGDEISAGITVRGSTVTEASGTALASGPLGGWQQSQRARLPANHTFEANDVFSAKPQGEYLVTRTLKVVEEQ